MKAIELVGHIVQFSEQCGNPVTNLRLQKLLYFIQKESLKELRIPAFDDEICAWQYGPVIPDVYYAFSFYADMPIINVSINLYIGENIVNIIRKVVRNFADTATWKLVDMTHEGNSPWSKTVREHKNVISWNDIISLPN